MRFANQVEAFVPRVLARRIPSAGKATIYLDTLQHLLPIEETTPIIDYKGAEQGELSVRLIPHMTEAPPKSALKFVEGAASGGAGGGDDDDDDEDLGADKMDELKGKKLGVTVCIDAARGLPPTNSVGVYVKYNFYLEDSTFKTPETTKKSINPRFG